MKTEEQEKQEFAQLGANIAESNPLPEKSEGRRKKKSPITSDLIPFVEPEGVTQVVKASKKLPQPIEENIPFVCPENFSVYEAKSGTENKDVTVVLEVADLLYDNGMVTRGERYVVKPRLLGVCAKANPDVEKFLVTHLTAEKVKNLLAGEPAARAEKRPHAPPPSGPMGNRLIPVRQSSFHRPAAEIAAALKSREWRHFARVGQINVFTSSTNEYRRTLNTQYAQQLPLDPSRAPQLGAPATAASPR